MTLLLLLSWCRFHFPSFETGLDWTTRTWQGWGCAVSALGFRDLAGFALTLGAGGSFLRGHTVLSLRRCNTTWEGVRPQLSQQSPAQAALPASDVAWVSLAQLVEPSSQSTAMWEMTKLRLSIWRGFGDEQSITEIMNKIILSAIHKLLQTITWDL